MNKFKLYSCIIVCMFMFFFLVINGIYVSLKDRTIIRLISNLAIGILVLCFMLSFIISAGYIAEPYATAISMTIGWVILVDIAFCLLCVLI